MIEEIERRVMLIKDTKGYPQYGGSISLTGQKSDNAGIDLHLLPVRRRRRRHHHHLLLLLPAFSI